MRALTILLYLSLLASCAAPVATQGLITVAVTADGQTLQVQIPAGSTAQQALDAAGLTLGALDRSEPPLYTVLSDGASLQLIRVVEEFEVEQVVIPFEHQVLRNESLPEGETRLTQPGVNGLQENTYRRVLEDGVEISRSIVKSVVVKEAVPEIVMVGSQTPFSPVAIPGRLAYLLGGNVWVMENTTGERRPVITTGDLDGRVFSLSPDGSWLLFTRRSDEDGEINALWAARLDGETTMMVDLKVANVVHFAAWQPSVAPNSVTLAYSTVEPRATAPGWQANNDLYLISVSLAGFVSRPTMELEANSGGIYGWWGTSFAWSPDGEQMAYVRPDGAGLLDFKTDVMTSVLDIIPLQTGSDWAWVPGLTWGPDGKMLYTVDHVPPPGSSAPEESPLFDLTALPLEGGAPVRVVSQVGMFAYPVPSPLQVLPSGENAYRVAYLQAIFPTQSDSSRYRLAVMDRDGSNRQTLFPPEGAPGLDPQRVVWSPSALDESTGFVVAIIYQGNLWLVSASTGEARQITGDGLAGRMDWK